MAEPRQTIIVVDDDEGIRRQLRWAFDEFEVLEAGTRQEALKLVEAHRPPVALLDLGLPPDADGPSEGLQALQEILATAPDTKVVMISGQDERQYAVQAVALGAYDFYEKPLQTHVLSLIVGRAFRLHELESENRRLAVERDGLPLPGLVTANPQLLEVCRTVRQLARTSVFVLLRGESGTGKEVLARAIHQLSPRSEGPFVAINCAAIPEQLMESELFGHEKGAFTGAIKTTAGKAELADKGTLFLDEVGDMPPGLQAKLLRFLQDLVVERVGGRVEIPVDTRVLSATNQNLQDLLRDGRFREDLYYRLSEVEVRIPPLRERTDDILLLAHHLLEGIAKSERRNVRGFAPEALAAMALHPWPGNVRELENRIKRAVVTTSGALIQVAGLDLDAAPTGRPAAAMTLKKARRLAEVDAIRAALNEANGNISQAARLLGTSRPTLYQLMEQYDLK